MVPHCWLDTGPNATIKLPCQGPYLHGSTENGKSFPPTPSLCPTIFFRSFESWFVPALDLHRLFPISCLHTPPLPHHTRHSGINTRQRDTRVTMPFMNPCIFCTHAYFCCHLRYLLSVFLRCEPYIIYLLWACATKRILLPY